MLKEICFLHFGDQRTWVFFEITPVDGPGSLVKGLIQGTCSLDNGESEDKFRISAEFKAKYIESEY